MKTQRCIACPRGSVLLTVLAVLTLFIVVATVCVTRWQHELRASEYPAARRQASLAAYAACQDVLARVSGHVIRGSRHERWWEGIAAPVSDRDARQHTGLLACPGVWRVEHDSMGRAIARYTVQIEDESGKLNVNVLGRAVGDGSSCALSPAELPLLSVPSERLPEGYQALAALRTQCHEGAVDVRAQTELARIVPSMSLSLIDPVETLDDDVPQALSAWISTSDRGCADGTLLNLNTASPRALYRHLRRVNTELHFEDDEDALSRACVNAIDSRDANHVISTLDRAYGVESIVFNEVLAHNGEHWIDARGIAPLGEGNGGAIRMGELYEIPFYPRDEVLLKLHTYRVAELDAEQLRVRLSADTRDNDVSQPLDRQPLADIRGLPRISMRDLVETLHGPDAVDGRGAIVWPENAFRGRTLLLSRDQQFSVTEAATVLASADGWLWLDQLPAAATGEVYAAFMPLLDPAGIALDKQHESEIWYVHGLEPGRYYCAQVFSFAGQGGPASQIDADGELLRVSSTSIEDAHCQYARRQPQRARDVEGLGGVVPITLTGRPARGRPSIVSYLRLFGAEAVELHNIGPQAVSLRGWSLALDRGTAQRQLHTIDDVVHYSDELQMQTHDSNPVIEAGEYMFIVNDQSLFDFEFGNQREGIWGNDSGETTPLARARRDTWGVPLRIEAVRAGFTVAEGLYRERIVACRGAAWTPGELRGELVQNRTQRSFGAGQNVRGTTFVVADNGRRTLTLLLRPEEHRIPWQRGDTIDILGLPRAGIDGALLLRDTYGQVCARADKLPVVARQRTFTSVAKTDAAGDEWRVCTAARMGGTPAKCHNPLHARASRVSAGVRNAWFGTPLDMLAVRSARPWQQLASDGVRVARVRRWLEAVLDTCTTDALWLPAEDAVRVTGAWRPAFGTASLEGTTTLVDHNAQWEPRMWIGHRLNLRSGERGGQSYPVTRSTANSVSVVGRSVPDRVHFRAQRGDDYCVGPQSPVGYYVTRAPQAESEWEWHDERLEPGRYQVSLVSVNDSTDSAAMLEENWNAELRVRAWNFVSGSYDTLAAGARSDKSDTVRAGLLSPDHIRSNTVRIAVRASGLNAPKCSGIAWFGGIMLHGVAVPGRLNVNSTAPALLHQLPGIDAEMAEGIFAGRPSDQGHEPWTQLSQTAWHCDWNIDEMGKCINLLRHDSAALRVTCIGEALEDVDVDGRFNADAGDRVRSREVQAYILTPLDTSNLVWHTRHIAAQPKLLRWALPR